MRTYDTKLASGKRDFEKDGGPAFPVQRLGSDGPPECEAHVGLSLRDYFAAAALTGVLANDWRSDDMKVLAEEAYEMAEAMLAERARRDNGEREDG